MTILTLSMIAGAMLVGGPQQDRGDVQRAKEDAAAAAALATAEDRGANAYVCKRIAPATGSRLNRGRQICKTAAEWQSIEEQIKTAMQENARQALQD
ncbi:hypothetical protein [Sphingomicrobium aestuariivivum]|uniref:hypothetical protein n=1 Tax=Sphingomicrobium aestuariivivum TaxID=1582356 RepID=UPI001FD698EE|nr:hypothetical protein [Sphingomicrobium aestuariivivum]MCJ8190926.1 hypothetical protein [Sphingomicrobium aestuariivivum]